MHGKAKRRRVNAAMLCADVSGLEATLARWARGRRQTGGIGWLAQAWAELPDSEIEEIRNMAAGGSATTAYECRVQADKLETKPTTKLRTDCATVAGSDMMRLRSKLAAFGVA